MSEKLMKKFNEFIKTLNKEQLQLFIELRDLENLEK